MSARCHLCGRRGVRGFTLTPARPLRAPDGFPFWTWDAREPGVLICTARAACRRRRGLRL